MKLNIFPLGIVAFPNKSIPLHIFEDRYKRMINDCIDNGNEFGIIYQNIKGIAEFGCTVSVTKLLKRYPDGRMDILSKGNRIFKLDSKKIVNDIVVGTITVLPKSNPLSSEVFDPLLEKYLKLLITLGADANLENHLKKSTTFQLLESVQLSPDFELELISMKNEAERAEFLNHFFNSLLEKSDLFKSNKRYNS